MRIDLSISLVWLILHVRTIAAEDITASDIQNVTILIEQFARAHVHLQQVASSLKKDDSKLGGSEETGAKLATLIGEVEKEGAQHDKNEQEEAERRKRRLEEEERAREEQRQREIKEERERQAKLKEEKEEEERSRLEKAKAEEAKAKEEKQKGANKDEERKPTLEEEKSPQVAAIPRPGRETSKATKDKKDTYLREKLQIPPCKTSDLTASVEELDKEHLRLISPHQAGIKNPRNICYMNAALQGLFNSSEFRQALLLLPKAPEEYSDADAAVTSALQAVFARMALASLQEGGVISIEPDLLKLFAGLGLTIGAQDDVSVALDALLNRMPTHLKQIYLMGGGEAAPYTSKSRLAVQYYENYVNALCSIEDVEGCLHEGGLIFLSEDSPKIISLRLPRSKTRERIKRLFPEFINLRAFHPHLGRDVFYRFRWAALYRGEFHYTSYVYNEFSNCYFHCNDSSCTRLDNFVGLRDACRPTYEIVNLEYVRVDPGKKSDAAIVLPKKLVYEALHLPGGFHESLKDPVKSTLEGLMGDYKPKEEKLPELEDLSIKVKPSPCQPTFLSERSNFEGPYALIPQKYFVIDDWPKLSLACLLLYNYPSLRVMMLGGGDWGMAYGEWETILTSVFTKLLLKEAFDDGSPAISLEDDETLDTKCKEKIAETSTQSVLQVFETLAANLRKDLVVDSLWMDYMKNGMKAEGRTLKLDCDKSASLLGCLENNAISFLNPPRHLTMILRNPKGLVFPEILSPGRSIYHGKVAVAYELHSILMNNSHVLLKNHNSGCWHQCTEDICGDTTSLPATEEERQKVVMVMYSLVYPSEKAVVDNIMSEFS